MNLDNTSYLQPLSGVFESVCIATIVNIIGGTILINTVLYYFQMLPLPLYYSEYSEKATRDATSKKKEADDSSKEGEMQPRSQSSLSRSDSHSYSKRKLSGQAAAAGGFVRNTSTGLERLQKVTEE